MMILARTSCTEQPLFADLHALSATIYRGDPNHYEQPRQVTVGGSSLAGERRHLDDWILMVPGPQEAFAPTNILNVYLRR